MKTLLTICAACGIAMAQSTGGGPAVGEQEALPNTILPPSGKPVPKMSNGKPDLSGMWEYRRGKTEDRPYREDVLPKVRELAKDNSVDPGVNCFLLGTPRVTSYPFPFKIVQSPKEIIILYEAMRTFRDIPTDGRRHSRLPENTFMGESIGHWEGDTLVVDTVGFNEKTWLAGAGAIHTEDLHVVERYSPTADGRIHYEAVAEDPQVLTKPWKVMEGLFNASSAGDMIPEYECIEGNRDIEHLYKTK